MLSKKSGKLFKIVIRWCNICGGMPFVWNGRRGKVCITRKGQIRWGAGCLIQFGLCIYTYFRLFQIVFELGNLQQCSSLLTSSAVETAPFYESSEIFNSQAKVDAETSLCFMHALIHTFIVALSVNTILNQKELVIFTNSYLKFTAHFREAYISRLRRSWNNGCEDLVQIMITMAISAPLLPTIHFLSNPWHPMYLTHYLVPYDKGVKITEQLDVGGLSYIINTYGLWATIFLIGVFAVFQIIFIWIVTSTVLFITVNVTISAFVFRSAIREMTIISLEENPLRKRGKSRHSQYLIPIYVTKDKLRSSSSLIRCYRSFQIVETLSHQCFSGLAFVMEVLQMFFISLMIFILLRFSQRLSTGCKIILVLVIMMSFLIWTFILSIVGRFKSRTERCCESWKFVKCNYLNEIKYMKIVKSSCIPITIWAGNNIFEMKIKHVPTFLYSIAYSVIAWNAIYRNYYC